MSDHHKQFVLCIPKQSLAAPVPDDGSAGRWNPAVLNVLACDLVFRRRSLVETDETLLQIIPYVLLLTYRDKRLHCLSYWRQPHASEERLAGKKSIGIGGHIELQDHSSDKLHSVEDVRDSVPFLEVANRPLDVINAAAIREVAEEAGVAATADKLFQVSLFYDNSNPVGRVHAGVLTTLLVPDYAAVRTGDELHDANWEDLKTLAQQPDTIFETWSQFAIKRTEKAVPAICY